MSNPPAGVPAILNPDVLACPACLCRLEPRRGGSQLACPTCAAHYASAAGIWNLLPRDTADAEVKDRERDGWRAVIEENRWFMDADTILGLPESHRDEPYWAKIVEAMEVADAVLAPLKGKVGLDIACGVGWAAARFARRGARMVALDYNDTIYNGLEAAVQLRGRGVEFDAVRGDGESLPVVADSLDFVFMCSALHHFPRPDLVLDGICRALKPGGVFVDICESFRTGFGDADREESHDRHVQFREAGINERVFTQREYEDMFCRAGLVMETHLARFDKPVPGRPPADWINSAAAVPGHPAGALRRAALSLVASTPLVHALRYWRLYFRVVNRVFVARKPA